MKSFEFSEDEINEEQASNNFINDERTVLKKTEAYEDIKKD